MTDLVTNPELAECILDIPYQYHLAAARKLVEMGVDMIWTGDDVGTQRAMLMSPRMWRRFLKPRMATFIATLKAINPQVKVAYHTDGTAWPIIPDLIEIGLDILNPVQPACMDPAELKRQYGQNLCFWGSIDEQHTLPFGTSQDVADEVLLRLRTIGRDGGLITRTDPSRTARHADGKLLGHDQHGNRHALCGAQDSRSERAPIGERR